MEEKIKQLDIWLVGISYRLIMGILHILIYIFMLIVLLMPIIFISLFIAGFLLLGKNVIQRDWSSVLFDLCILGIMFVGFYLARGLLEFNKRRKLLNHERKN